MESLLDQLQLDGHITLDQVRVVNIECEATQVLPSTVLLQCEFVSETVLSRYDNNHLSVTLNAAEFVPDQRALALLDEHKARRFCALPMSLNQASNQLVVVLDDLSNVLVRDAIRRHIAKQIQLEFRQSSTTDIRQVLDKCYGYSYSLASVLEEVDQKPHAYAADDSLSAAPVVRLIDTLLQDAITRRASDIHLSPEPTHVQVRYRVDGVLTTICCIHIRYWPAMLVRIKVLSQLDIAETRLPQDGHVARIIHGTHIDFRVASFPLHTGENLVLRVLDRRRGVLGLNALCNDEKTQSVLCEMVCQPSGLVVVCGPTGAGKTTTLYAMLRALNAESLNIMTLEDPVEYPMPNIRQTRVNGNSAMGFAEGVRSVLRQDPDVILVGEVRDSDSCHMSCRAALTGHLVLTSTHADSAIGAIGRLLELGVSRSVLANVLSGVVSQRLLRKVCSHCHARLADCGVCFGSGYSGRLALYECLTVTESFANHLHSNASLAELRHIAIEEGLQPLRLQANEKLKAGKVSSQEIVRVFGEQDHV